MQVGQWRKKMLRKVKEFKEFSLEEHQTEYLPTTKRKMTYMKFIATPIASLVVISNLCVIILFLRNKIWLKKPYNIFILNLAFTDFTTGVLMLIAPGLSFKPTTIPDNLFFGRLYCLTIAGYWLFFALGAVSVFTCLFLTVERWTAICRPFKYRMRFATKHLILYLILIWILGFGTSRVGTVERSYQPKTSNITAAKCISTPVVEGNLIGAITVISVSLKFFIPSGIILVLYALAIKKIRETGKQFQGQNKREQVIKNVTKMAATASLALIACWLPNQIYLILVKYDQAKLFSHFHNATIVVVSLNSTLNPFIYALWGKKFRTRIKSVLCACHCHTTTSDVTLNSGQQGIYDTSLVSGQKNNAFEGNTSV